MKTYMNVYNGDISRHQDFREQRKMLQVEPNTNMNGYNAAFSIHNRNFREHHPQILPILEPNTYRDMNMNNVYADFLHYHRDIGRQKQRREMQEANTLRDMIAVYAHLRHLDEQRRTMTKPSALLNKALAAMHTIVDCVALVREEEDTTAKMNMNMNMNTASTGTSTKDNNSPSNDHIPMYHNFQSSSLLSSSSSSLSSSPTDFQQHLHQLQRKQQMKHELDQLQKRQQELVHIMNTNTTTMSMLMSQNQQEQDHQQQQQQQQQQQLESSSAAIATTSTTITPPITEKKAVKLGKPNFTSSSTEEAEEPTCTIDNNNNNKNTVPSELDILIGRGRGVDNHRGNIYYRKVVESFRKQYETISQKGDKTKFIRDVVAIMYDNGHQFVKKVKDDPNPTSRSGSAATTTSSTCTWVPVDRDVARDKVSNSFRNAKRLRTASASTSTSTK